MRILIDADACSVKRHIEDVAMKYRVQVLFFANSSSRIRPGYGRVFTVSRKPEAADEELFWQCAKNDVVVTDDFELAAKCMTKGAYVVHQNGWQYTEKTLLEKREKQMKKRRKEDNENFKWTLELMVITALEQKIS